MRSGRLPRVTGKQVPGAFKRAGFEVMHIRGSHHYLRKDGFPRLVVVPVHGSRVTPPGTLNSILKQAGMDKKEFIALL